MTTTCTMILGDCLEVMPTLPAQSVNMSFSDFPYGTTDNGWDQIICIKSCLGDLQRVMTHTHCSAFSATANFASLLISALGKAFRYDLVWDKTRVSGFLNAHRAPLRRHEWIIISSSGRLLYNAIKQPAETGRQISGQSVTSHTQTSNYRMCVRPKKYIYTEERFPTSILTSRFGSRERGKHPTQKPVALLDWLIRRYSNAGDNVLDPVSGSGSSAVAGLTCGRNVTCIEKDEVYFDASVERVKKTIVDGNLDVKLYVRR